MANPADVALTAAGTLDVSTPGKGGRSVQGLTPEKAKANPDLKSLKERARLPTPSELADWPGLDEANQRLLAAKRAKEQAEQAED